MMLRKESARKTDIEGDGNGIKQSERKQNRKVKETRCSLWVVWSWLCPINTGEQLDRPGPPR